ncbi:MAG: YbjQ family protein [Mariprofundaceae bacterium]|nr:YbjQ family protein [Mariprofundaceae bacterium]
MLFLLLCINEKDQAPQSMQSMTRQHRRKKEKKKLKIISTPEEESTQQTKKSIEPHQEAIQQKEHDSIKQQNNTTTIEHTKASSGIGHYAIQHQGGMFHMILSNLESILGKRVNRHLGVVNGSTVRAKHIGRDLMAGFKNIIGGELRGYTELLQESREKAIQRMSEQAKSIGANAVLNIRFSTSSVAQGAAELYVYGTTVILESYHD